MPPAALPDLDPDALALEAAEKAARTYARRYRNVSVPEALGAAWEGARLALDTWRGDRDTLLGWMHKKAYWKIQDSFACFQTWASKKPRIQPTPASMYDVPIELMARDDAAGERLGDEDEAELLGVWLDRIKASASDRMIANLVWIEKVRIKDLSAQWRVHPRTIDRRLRSIRTRIARFGLGS